MKYFFELKNNRTGEEIPEFKTTVEVTFTDKELIFDFFCKNSKFYSATDKYNGPLYDGDVCEAFICTGGDITKYYEIEVAPNNCAFLEKITNLHNDNNVIEDPIEENFLTTEIELLGNDYRCKFSVPLDKIGYDENVGILLNIFRIETEGGYSDKNLLAVNPTLQDGFHRPAFFFELKNK